MFFLLLLFPFSLFWIFCKCFSFYFYDFRNCHEIFHAVDGNVLTSFVCQYIYIYMCVCVFVVFVVVAGQRNEWAIIWLVVKLPVNEFLIFSINCLVCVFVFGWWVAAFLTSNNYFCLTYFLSFILSFFHSYIIAKSTFPWIIVLHEHHHPWYQLQGPNSQNLDFKDWFLSGIEKLKKRKDIFNILVFNSALLEFSRIDFFICWYWISRFYFPFHWGVLSSIWHFSCHLFDLVFFFFCARHFNSLSCLIIACLILYSCLFIFICLSHVFVVCFCVHSFITHQEHVSCLSFVFTKIKMSLNQFIFFFSSKKNVNSKIYYYIFTSN